MGDAADRQQRAQTRQSGDAADQELTAGRDLVRRRLVLRRHAAHRIRDHAVDQLECLAARRRRGARGPSPTLSSVR